MNYSTGTNARISLTPWLRHVSGWGEGQRAMSDIAPDATFESYLKHLNLSNTAERQLRNAYGSIYNTWLAKLMGDFVGEPYRFADFLGDFDINRELARVSPEARYEQPGRFQHRARWVQFS